MSQPVAVKLSDMTFASRAQIVKAHAIDSIAWVTPIAVAALILSIPGALSIPALVTVVVISALAVALFGVLADYMHFRREGFTKGMDKLRLRSVDPRTAKHYITAMASKHSLFRYLSGRTLVIVFA